MGYLLDLGNKEVNRMTISEKKMQIVIDNYFKSECNVNTSIRQAFEKGFRIGVKKGQSAGPERKKGKWIVTSEFSDCYYAKCNQCKTTQVFYYDKPLTNFCPNCGCQMNGGEENGNE